MIYSDHYDAPDDVTLPRLSASARTIAALDAVADLDGNPTLMLMSDSADEQTFRLWASSRNLRVTEHEHSDGYRSLRIVSDAMLMNQPHLTLIVRVTP